MNRDIKGWRVYSKATPGRRTGKLLDIVFFDRTMSEEEVKRSLIDHDGFPSDIIVLADREI